MAEEDGTPSEKGKVTRQRPTVTVSLGPVAVQTLQRVTRYRHGKRSSAVETVLHFYDYVLANCTIDTISFGHFLTLCKMLNGHLYEGWPDPKIYVRVVLAETVKEIDDTEAKMREIYGEGDGGVDGAWMERFETERRHLDELTHLVDALTPVQCLVLLEKATEAIHGSEEPELTNHCRAVYQTIRGHRPLRQPGA